MKARALVVLVVGALVKLFTFKSPTMHYHANAGVSTKPQDGTRVELVLRQPRA